MLIPDRNGAVSGTDYRYGFQAQECDQEMSNSASHYAFEYRIHDARIGRFLSVDPLAASYAYNSTYAFCENSVIAYKELEGKEKLVAYIFDITTTMQLNEPQNATLLSQIQSIIPLIPLKPEYTLNYRVEHLEGNENKYRLTASIYNENNELIASATKDVDERGFWSVLMSEGPFNAIGGSGTGQALDNYYRQPENGIRLAIMVALSWTGGAFGVSTGAGSSEVQNAKGAMNSSSTSTVTVTIDRSAYEESTNVTKRGKVNSVKNVNTNINREEFAKNLKESGYVESKSKDGSTTIYKKGDSQYSIRSDGKQTVDFNKSGGGKPDLKIRLNRPPTK